MRPENCMMLRRLGVVPLLPGGMYRQLQEIYLKCLQDLCTTQH